MTVFTRDELRDLITAIDVLTGAFAPELEEPIKDLYRHGTEGGHRIRAVFHKIEAVLAAEADEPA